MLVGPCEDASRGAEGLFLYTSSSSLPSGVNGVVSSGSPEARRPLCGANRTNGWWRTNKGKKEFSSTKDAPKQVFATIASTAPSKYTLGTIVIKSMVARAPVKAKESSSLLR